MRMRVQFGQRGANLFGRIGEIAAQSDNGKMRIHFRRPLLKRQRFGFGKENNRGNTRHGQNVDNIEFRRTRTRTHHNHAQHNINQQQQDFHAEPRRIKRRKMGNLHQPQAGKQQHGVVQMRHGFPNACQRLLRMTPEQEKTDVEQQDGDGNENLMAVFYKQILHGSFLC